MWWAVAALVISVVASFAMRPKMQDSVAGTLGDINAPTAEDGREIPVLFGTINIKSANVVWYGDLRTTAIVK